MDIITRSLLDEFVTQQELRGLSEEDAFEHFTGYLVTSQHYTESFSTDDIHIGGGGDGGIDTISIIVNGNLISEPEEIADLEIANKYLDVVFVFNQAERTPGFSASKVSNFGYGICDFFSDTPRLTRNDDLQKKVAIIKEIYHRSSKFRKGNPDCYMYYATTGRWVSDNDLSSRRDSVLEDVERLSLFRTVKFDFVDATAIQNLYRATKNAISRVINFPMQFALPDLEGIEQSFVGVLGATEYLKLIENNNGEIITSIFYDNVRHWQEWNAVNKEIGTTLEDASRKILFPLLNNGITIIARRILPTGNRFLIEDYQVVNGCQTSFVLHEKRDNLSADILIPIRLIATGNSEIRDGIIKATNRQTQVTEDQLVSLSDFPKRLEGYFVTYAGSKKLFYERRSRQYSADDSVEKVRIIGMQALVRAYASIFLQIPHRTTRNYKNLLTNIGNTIFNKDHRLEMYYVSAYMHYRLEFLFRTGVLESVLKPSRYHLMYLLGLMLFPPALPAMNSNDMKRLCEGMMEKIWDETISREMFLTASEIVREAAEGDFHGDNVRTDPFTDKVKRLYFDIRARNNSSPSIT